MILYHPRPILSPESERPTLFFIEDEPAWDTETVRAYMAEHSLQRGNPALATSAVNVRKPFAGELKTIPSPDDENTTFTIRHCGVRENVARKNLASTVRYVQEAGSERFVSEKDYPVGDLELNTVLLGLHSWNIHDEQKNPVPLNERTVQDWLSPEEYDYLYNAVLDLNPVWRGGGEAEAKKS